MLPQLWPEAAQTEKGFMGKDRYMTWRNADREEREREKTRGDFSRRKRAKMKGHRMVERGKG